MKTKMTILSLLTLSLAAPSFADDGKTVAPDRKVVATTSIKDENCVLIDADILYPEPEIDFFRQECAGLGGYQVIFSGGDIRSYIGLKYGKKEMTFPVRHGQFPNVASDSLEWRATVKDNKVATYETIVFKMTASDADSDKQKEILTWVAVKLAGAKSCIIGAVDEDAKTTEADAVAAIRKIADDASKAKCLSDAE